MLVVKYDPQGFVTTFDSDTGTLIRGDLADGTEPITASSPELIDCKITDYCEKACPYCYMDSSPQGKHCSLENYQLIISQLADLQVFQIALGGGEPTAHPDFVNILKLTRKSGIVPNYSTGALRMSPEILEATLEYCGAVAISWWNQPLSLVSELAEKGGQINIHYVLSERTVEGAIRLMNLFDQFGKINAIIFLRFKPVGRGANTGETGHFSPGTLDTFWATIMLPHPYHIGFDSCMLPLVIEAINPDPRLYDLCDAGRFSGFIDAVNMSMSPCSFDKSSVSLINQSIKDAWRSLTKTASVCNCRIGLFAHE